MYFRVLPSWTVGIKMQNLHVQLQSHTVGMREAYTTTLRLLLPAQVISTKQNTALRHQCTHRAGIPREPAVPPPLFIKVLDKASPGTQGTTFQEF